MKDQNENEGLENAPTLRGASRHSAFQVPDGFFDRFPLVMQERIAAEHAGPSWSGLIARFKPRVALFATTLIAVLVITWVAWPTAPSPLVAIGEQVQPEELFSLDLDEDLIYDAFMDEDPLMNTVLLDLNENELIAYLDLEDVSLELLIEEL